MFLHRKELIQPVTVGKPDARFGTYLLEQFGGATGELTAALQYWVQSFHVENAGIRDTSGAVNVASSPVGIRVMTNLCVRTAAMPGL
jgi:Mn-containing catalase